MARTTVSDLSVDELKKLIREVVIQTLSKAILGLFLTLLVACSGAGKDQLSVGDDAPPFTLNAADGSSVSLSNYIGKSDVLLYFNMAYG